MPGQAVVVLSLHFDCQIQNRPLMPRHRIRLSSCPLQTLLHKQKLAVDEDEDWACFVDAPGGASQKQRRFASEVTEGSFQQVRDELAVETVKALVLVVDNAAVVVVVLQELLQIDLVAKEPKRFGQIAEIACLAVEMEAVVVVVVLEQVPKQTKARRERLGLFAEAQVFDDAAEV